MTETISLTDLTTALIGQWFSYGSDTLHCKRTKLMWGTKLAIFTTKKTLVLTGEQCQRICIIQKTSKVKHNIFSTQTIRLKAVDSVDGRRKYDWNDEHDRIILTNTAKVAAEKLGRSIVTINWRKREIISRLSSKNATDWLAMSDDNILNMHIGTLRKLFPDIEQDELVSRKKLALAKTKPIKSVKVKKAKSEKKERKLSGKKFAWTDAEDRIILTNATNAVILKVLPGRTKAAINFRRCFLRSERGIKISTIEVGCAVTNKHSSFRGKVIAIEESDDSCFCDVDIRSGSHKSVGQTVRFKSAYLIRIDAID